MNVTTALHGLLKIGRISSESICGSLNADTSLFDPSDGVSVVRPEVDQEGYWVGSPYPLSDGEKVYLYYRYRDPRRRGWKAVVAESDNGEDFTPVVKIDRIEVGAISLEGGALVKERGDYVLYLSFNDCEDRRWKIKAIKARNISFLNGSPGPRVHRFPLKPRNIPIVHYLG